MDLSESFLTAFDSLLNNKLRAILTMLGVIIGVGAVIALMSVGNGFRVYVTQQIQAIGSNLLTVSTDDNQSNGYHYRREENGERQLDQATPPCLARTDIR